MQYDCIKKIGEMEKQTKSPGVLLLRYNCLLLLWDLVLKSEMSFIEKIKPSENDVNLGCTSHFVRRRQWHPTPVLLPGKSHGWRSLVGCSPWGHEESHTTEWLHFHFSLSCIGGGNGNPLQCSYLENPRDRGAWWAAVYGVTQSRTRLKRLSSSSSSTHFVKYLLSTYHLLLIFQRLRVSQKQDI